MWGEAAHPDCDGRSLHTDKESSIVSFRGFGHPRGDRRGISSVAEPGDHLAVIERRLPLARDRLTLPTIN